jgi:hypothetical protein
MKEDEIKELAKDIVEAIVDLSLGKEPNIISARTFKNVAKHSKFEDMKNLYIEFLTSFNLSADSSSELRGLTDFRIKMVELYNVEEKQE